MGNGVSSRVIDEADKVHGQGGREDGVLRVGQDATPMKGVQRGDGAGQERRIRVGAEEVVHVRPCPKAKRAKMPCEGSGEGLHEKGIWSNAEGQTVEAVVFAVQRKGGEAASGGRKGEMVKWLGEVDFFHESPVGQRIETEHMREGWEREPGCWDVMGERRTVDNEPALVGRLWHRENGTKVKSSNCRLNMPRFKHRSNRGA